MAQVLQARQDQTAQQIRVGVAAAAQVEVELEEQAGLAS
jgi:hypothetical protein